MQSTKLLFAILASFLLMGLVSAASVDFVAPTPDNDIITNGVIDYKAQVSDVTVDQVVDFDVVLYTSTYDYVSGNEDWSDVLSVEGSFSSLEDGQYILYAGVTFLDGTDEFSTQLITLDRDYQLNNPISALYSDPTPANGSVVNSYNVNTAKIIAVADQTVDEMILMVFNSSGELIYNDSIPDVKKSQFLISDIWNQVGDGTYTYHVAVFDGDEDPAESQTKTRTITIKAVVPTASDITVAGIPESVNEDTVFSFSADLIVSEQPVKVRAVAQNGLKSASLGFNDVTDLELENLSFSGAIAEPGQYKVSIIVSDSYGNSNKYEVGNVSVSDVAEPVGEQEPVRRNGRRNNNNDDNDVNNTRPPSRFNLTLGELPNEEEPEEKEEQTDENPGLLSFITGAVTGAFSTPPRAILTFIIIVVIIYAIVKIRGYVVAEEEKPKKNGKKSSKKDKVEEEEPSEE